MTTIANRIIAASVLLYLLITTASATHAAPISDLSAGQAGAIEYTSRTVVFYDMITKPISSAPIITIPGTLTFPAGFSGKVPAMVVSHHCNGITDSVTNLAAMLNGLGIATFVPDSYTPRGYPNGVCTAGGTSAVNHGSQTADALYALKLLATHPNIDASRIGIVGQSAGGNPSMLSAFEEMRKAVIGDSLKFAAHIGMYPAFCTWHNWSPNMTGAPMLLLLGAADDEMSATYCAAFATMLRAQAKPSPQITTIIYPDAPHAWDNPTGSPIYKSGPTNFSKCYGEFRMDVLKSFRYDTGAPLTDTAGYIGACTSKGVTEGHYEPARVASYNNIAIFLAKTFKLTNVALSASQPDRIFNYLEAAYPSYLAPAGAASQTSGSYYFRYYPTTNSYIATNGDGQVYYYAPGSTASPLPIGGEAAWLNTAGQHDF